jgi:hypothetical protein
MNAHIDTMLQASGTTRAIRWVKKVTDEDRAASEAAYRKFTREGVDDAVRYLLHKYDGVGKDD